MKTGVGSFAMQFSILGRRHEIFLFKGAHEVAGILIPELSANLSDGQAGVAQKGLCVPETDFPQQL